jgi:cobalt-zinc-cadmium efflux system membrane fusion protein
MISMPFHVKSLVGTRVFLLSTVLSAFVLTGCGKPSAPVAAEAAKPAGDPLQIKVEPSMASRFVVGEVRMSNLVPIQEVPGRIEANERQVTRIGASVTGLSLIHI